MRLVENVQDVTLDSLRAFVEQADRNGAPGDTPVAMTRARNGGVLTIAVDFQPRAQATTTIGLVTTPPLPPGTYTNDDPPLTGIALAARGGPGADEKEAQ